MPQPVRITRSRQHKQVSPNELPIVYVGRRTKFGNPYKITDASVVGQAFLMRLDDEKDNIIRPEKWYLHMAAVEHFKSFVNRTSRLVEFAQKELQSKNLSCWCPAGMPCHADVLLEIVNGTYPPLPPAPAVK